MHTHAHIVFLLLPLLLPAFVVHPAAGQPARQQACNGKADGDACSYVYGGGPNAGQTATGTCSGGECSTGTSGGDGGGGGSGGTSTATKCAQNGQGYEYAETVSGGTRTITYNVCPNHYYDDGNLNPNSAYTRGTVTVNMPASPKLESTVTDDVSDQGGGVGVLFNGALVYSAFAGSVALTGYSTSATALEGNTFDKCGCHSSSTNAAGYHCHIPPSCLLHQLGQTTDAHSPQIGWAPDGFPIYGPRTVGGLKIKLCTESTNTDSTYCMDSCNGLSMEIPALDGFKYRYYFSGEDYLDGSHPTDPLAADDSTQCNRGRTDCINPLSTSPYYPFTPMCYRGCCPPGVTCSGTNAALPLCSGSASDGVSSGYMAAAKYPAGLPIYTGQPMATPGFSPSSSSTPPSTMTGTSPSSSDPSSGTGVTSPSTAEAAVSPSSATTSSHSSGLANSPSTAGVLPGSTSSPASPAAGVVTSSGATPAGSNSATAGISPSSSSSSTGTRSGGNSTFGDISMTGSGTRLGGGRILRAGLDVAVLVFIPMLVLAL